MGVSHTRQCQVRHPSSSHFSHSSSHRTVNCCFQVAMGQPPRHVQVHQHTEPCRAIGRGSNSDPPSRASPKTSTRRTTLLSVAGFSLAPSALLESLKGEASLWQQEAQLYSRKAAEAFSEATGNTKSPAAQQLASAAAAIPLDASLAAALLDAPLLALQSSSGSSAAADTDRSAGSTAPEPPALPPLDEERYRRDYEALLAQELPYFQQAGSCGHCGDLKDGGALSDRAWFDFLSYIQYKALGRQLGASLAAPGAPDTALPGWERMHAASPEMQLHAAEAAWAATGERPGAGGAYAGTPQQQLAAAQAAYRERGQALSGASGSSSSAQNVQLSPADALRLALGTVILRHIEADLEAAAGGSNDRVEASGSSKGDAAAMLLAIRSENPELDAVREGTQALLSYFSSRGFVASASCAQFGLSQDEYENHYTWSLGEPAFLKYWLEAPATMRSAAALDAEQGFSQDYVAATLQAHFRRCGVAATALKRYPSYSQPELVAEQWTLRRLAPLPDGYDWQQYREWRPDFSCPLADEACY